ncbi:hypothetical protein [Tetragenococcus koreensis]|uniref:Uncharacterized protein n=1 Tax=Tetragenococcus koreensis TaxID=290335 RepID=A0AAN4ZSJ6_9ENTE|nr:hypothetical protein [Tetragenococcus koreensis]GEQ49657.1 hypothetical protein TK11N_15090 [Tetragenococcus koreensis]GEQ52103.1 hypothetical protein TK12N_14470 [Tetragenococcus koreensis]GEQ54638.1 hypothetical protein TK2N_14820 [Tetragenococcus koreensis]GEQ57082.1 hypothetical protein TK4N_14250 [Tetragenococcus koreensis]GEQ59670.1 hypothetical protein TK6N_15090 [Tetragenococcus koreensis]
MNFIKFLIDNFMVILPVLTAVFSLLVAYYNYLKYDTLKKFYFSSSIEKFSAFMATLIGYLALTFLILISIFIFNNLKIGDIQQEYLNSETDNVEFTFLLIYLVMSTFAGVALFFELFNMLFKPAYKTPKGRFYVNSNSLSMSDIPKNQKVYLIEALGDIKQWVCKYRNENKDLERVLISYEVIKNVTVYPNKETNLAFINKAFQELDKQTKKILAVILSSVSGIFLVLGIWFHMLWGVFFFIMMAVLLVFSPSICKKIWQKIFPPKK